MELGSMHRMENKGARDKKKGWCHYCGKLGHFIKDCRKKQYDERNKAKGKEERRQGPTPNGATHNFIDENLLWSSGIISLAKESPDTIRLANGEAQLSTLTLPKARTHIGTYKDALDYHATRLKGFDAILGKEWLARVNPVIDWKQNTVQFKFHDKKHTLRTPPEEDVDFSVRHMMLTHTELENALARKEPMYLCTLKDEPSPDIIVPEEFKAILAEFPDVLNGLPSGLPPERAVDHTIELEPGHAPTHRGIYPLSTYELEELRKQIDDLLQKGFIRPS
eukprot:scaffold9713_cov25-Tisochrysis_lutea.AAC.1